MPSTAGSLWHPTNGHARLESAVRVCAGAVRHQRIRPPARHSVAVRSAMRPTAALSTYPLMERRSANGNRGGKAGSGLGTAIDSRDWLPSGVRDIVATLGQQGRRPLLQLVLSSSSKTGSSQHRFQAVPISQAVADDPQSWSMFADRVRSSGANGLVLVRPIPSPDQYCVYSVSQSASAASPSAADYRCKPSSAQPSDTRGSAPAAGRAVLEGQVGDCCSAGSSSSEPQHPHTPLVDRAGTRDSDRTAPAACSPSGAGWSGSAEYYGLVVQSSVSSDADGCWVLKLTRSDSGGAPGLCTCTHFTLTRVCLGQPLYTQLRDAWLTGPAYA